MSDPLSKFPLFCESLKINSKEFGIVPLRFWGTQKYYLEEIQRGMQDGVRFFVALKGRQGGISTVSLALVLYWMNKFPGSLGAMVTDDGSNLVRFRSILTGYMRSLPRSFKSPEDHHNIFELELRNKSVLSYLVAGKRRKAEQGDLGQGKGLNLLHATEVSSWGDEKQIDKLMDSLAERHLHRLYLLESTANSFNLWFDIWETAKKAQNQRAIFIGWWRHDLYRFDRNSDVYRVYWDGRYTREELAWVRDIKALYGFEIQPEQMAWWRYQLVEKKRNDMIALYTEHPPTEEYAFQMSGYKYFDGDKLTKDYRAALKAHYTPLRYTFGKDFEETQVHKTTKSNAELKVWRLPQPNGMYSISVDPSWGFNESSDQAVIEVFRCYSDCLEQVAEYTQRGVRPDQLAWVILHLVGEYQNCRVNIELTGGGGYAVHVELKHLMEKQRFLRSRFASAFDGYKPYLYARPDSLASSFAYHSKTGNDQKNRMMEHMKSMYETDKLIIHSMDALTEMKYFCKSGDVLEGRGGANDDTVIAIALNMLNYVDWARKPLMIQGATKEKLDREEEGGKSTQASILTDFFKSRGIEMP